MTYRRISFLDSGAAHVSFSYYTGGIGGAYYYPQSDHAKDIRNHFVMVGNERIDYVGPPICETPHMGSLQLIAHHGLKKMICPVCYTPSRFHEYEDYHGLPD